MSKGLEALKRNRDFIERYFVKQVEETGVYHKNMKDEMFNDLSIIEKELKALEIIKNIGILKPYETSGGQCWLETMCDATKITKDNYDLLKEVLL